MNILALEGAADFWGLALAEIKTTAEGEGAVQSLAVAIENEPRTLARELFSRVQQTLDLAQLNVEEVDALAVGIGPGSWTGLRIGLTAMKTWAQTRSLPLAGVPSFDPIAQAIWRKTESKKTALLLVVEKCRPGELYGKIYECGPDYLSIAQSEWIGSPQLMAATLGTESLARGLDAPPILAGGAQQEIAEIFAARGEEYTINQADREQILLELAIAGAGAIESGEAADPMTLAPLYLAPSNAERALLSR